MVQLNDKREVNCSASQLYRVVADIERYPEFLPWCGAVEVHEHKDRELIATVTGEHKKMHQTISVCYLLEPDKQINMLLLKGPLKELKAQWEFEDVSDENSVVTLAVEVEFPNKLIAFAFKPLFKKYFNQVVDLFCERAKLLSL